MEPHNPPLQPVSANLLQQVPSPPRLVRRRPGRRRLLGHVPLLVWLLCAAGFGLLLLTLWVAGFSWAISIFGVTVDGEVKGRSPVPTRGDRGGRVKFTYFVKGVEYSAEDTVDEAALEGLHMGTPVKVRVLSGWPKQPLLVEPVGRSGRGSGFYLALAWLGNIALVLLVRVCLRRPLRQRALVCEGVATEGMIVGKEAGSGRRASHAVQYSYHAPRYGMALADREWHVRMLVSREDFEAAQVGAAVTVLYDPRQPSRSLIYPFADYEAVGTLSEPHLD
jgi:Protein of unknown function (DUF3592)